MLLLLLLTLLPGQFPALESGDFSPELQQAALAATVRVQNLTVGTTGSGVIVGVQGPFVYVLTAGHNVRAGKEFEVAAFAPDTYPKPKQVSQVVVVKAESQGVKDLALLRVEMTEKVAAPLQFRPKPRDIGIAAKTGLTVLTVGCDDGAPTCRIETVDKATLFSREAGGEKGKLWEVSRAQAEGRSGGPMLDKKGRIIGICSGNNGARGYFCHIQEIETFLTRHRFGYLLGDPRP
jgi:S1-C subfamily serine protease